MMLVAAEVDLMTEVSFESGCLEEPDWWPALAVEAVRL